MFWAICVAGPVNESLLWLKKKVCFLQGDRGEKGSKGEIGLPGPTGPAGSKVSLFFYGNPFLCVLFKIL